MPFARMVDGGTRVCARVHAVSIASKRNENAMWSTIRTYESYDIVVCRYVGSTGYVDWVIRNTDGHFLERHFEPIPVQG